MNSYRGDSGEFKAGVYTDGIVVHGHAVYYNHARSRWALNGRMPAEAAGIGVARRRDEPRWAALVPASYTENSA